jgi:Thioesterase-like superfamily
MASKVSADGSESILEAFSRVSSVRFRSDGIFDADVSDEWTILGKPNGGYLLALLGRAASSLTDGRHVVAASAHYLRSPAPGPVEIEVELLRHGRSVSQVRARMSQAGRPCVEAQMTASEADLTAAPRWDAGVPDAQVVPFEKSVRLAPVTPDGFRVPILDQVDLRFDPELSRMMSGYRSGRGQLRGWLRLFEEESFDPISLLYAVDAFPSPTFDTDISGWPSTLEMTVYVRGIPAPGPVRVVNYARFIDSRCADWACDVWDGESRLVAQATQLAVLSG